jgi:hypothetical protein
LIFLQSIENLQRRVEDPVTESLLAFAQKPDATLDMVIDALIEMGRQDILLKVYNPITGIMSLSFLIKSILYTIIMAAKLKNLFFYYFLSSMHLLFIEFDFKKCILIILQD